LFNQVQFQRACMERINLLPPTLRRQDWEQLLNQLLREMVEMDFRQLAHFDTPWICHNQFCPPRPYGALDSPPDNGMALGRVGSYDEQDIGIVYIRDGIAHGPASERGKRCSYSRGVTEASAVIDIVCAENRPGKFLDHIIILISALGRTEHAHGIGAVMLKDFRNPLGHTIQGLIPTPLAKYAGRVALEAGFFPCLFSSNQRPGQPLRWPSGWGFR